jgi:hypothetical protein
MTGSCSDGVGEVGVNKIEYSLGMAGGNYWCVKASNPASCPAGDSFVDPFPATELWNVAFTTTSPTWQMWAATGVVWTDGQTYTLRSRAYDAATNLQIVYPSTITFQYDTQMPTSTVTFPQVASTFYEAITAITGTAADRPAVANSGLQSVKVGIERTSDGKFWTAGGWLSVASRDDLTATGLTSWTLPAPTFDTSTDTYRLYTWARDKVVKPDSTYNNAESTSTIDLTFNFEAQAPVSTITVPVTDYPSRLAIYNKTTNTLPTISGTAYDQPTTSNNAGIWKIWVDVRDAGPDNLFNAVDDRWYDSAGTSDFTSTLQMHSTYTVTGGSALPFTLSIPVNTYASSAGRKYRVTSRAFDNGLNAAGTKVGVQESPADITSDSSETNGNVDFFVIDTSAPVTSINLPSHGSSPTGITVVSGTSYDPEGFSNQGTSVTVVNIAYYENSGNGGADRFWNFATQTYSILQDPNVATLPDTVFSTVTSPSNLGGTPNTFQWIATGASTPSFTNDRTYQIFVRTRDITGNVSSNPASAASNTSRIQFTKAAPTPQSGITTPATNNGHYQATSLTSLAGTTQDSTTAQFRLTNGGPDNTFDSGGDDQAWNGTAWVSTTAFAGYLGAATGPGRQLGRGTGRGTGR